MLIKHLNNEVLPILPVFTLFYTNMIPATIFWLFPPLVVCVALADTCVSVSCSVKVESSSQAVEDLGCGL